MITEKSIQDYLRVAEEQIKRSANTPDMYHTNCLLSSVVILEQKNSFFHHYN